MRITEQHVVPRLHLRLTDARRDHERMRELARRLALALDQEVDARHGRASLDAKRTGEVLLEARRQGLL